MAVAGFTAAELSITAQQDVIIVTDWKADAQSLEYLNRSILASAFERRFSLANFIRVKDASYVDGILSIDLVREIPEEMKPRKIATGQAPRHEAIEHKQAPRQETIEHKAA